MGVTRQPDGSYAEDVQIKGIESIDQLPAALAAGGGLRVEGVAGGVAQPITVAPISSIVYGQTTVTAHGTAEALGASVALVSGVRIKALAANTGNIYIGDVNVDSTNGFILAAGEEVFVECDDLASIYIDSDADSEGVSYIGG